MALQFVRHIQLRCRQSIPSSLQFYALHKSIPTYNPSITSSIFQFSFFTPNTSNLGAIRLKTKSARQLKKMKMRKLRKEMKEIPPIKTTLRKLYLRIHPDLFGQSPNEQKINEKSYQELSGLLDIIEKGPGFPSAKSYELPFYLKTSIPDQFQKVLFKVKTNGGACQLEMANALADFFIACDLPPVFEWTEGSWGLTIGPQKKVNTNWEYDETERSIKTDTIDIAPAYQDYGSRKQEDHSIEKMLNDLDPVFHAIGLFGVYCQITSQGLDIESEFTMDKDGENIRANEEIENAIDALEGNGYKVRDRIQLIWQGIREENDVTNGLDINSAMIMQRIMMHTMEIERQAMQDIMSGHFQKNLDNEQA